MTEKSFLGRLPPWGVHSLGTVTGALVASGLMAYLLWPNPNPGEEKPLRIQAQTFNVAVMSGQREEAKVASEVTENVVQDEVVVPSPTAPAVVTQEIKSTLPDAVAAAAEPSAKQKPVIPKEVKEEVIPPARVAMPGGRLTEAPIQAGKGGSTTLLPPGKAEVLLRYMVNKHGEVVRGGVFKQGQDPMRDIFIDKAMRSRTYSIQNWPKARVGDEEFWVVELVIPYKSVPEAAIP